jgi:hypothetical protein
MTYQEILNKLSGDIGISPDIIDKAYKAYWRYIRDSIQELPLKEDMSEEEFLILKPNFNIPSLGKLTCTYQKYKCIKEKFKHIKKLRENNEST